MSKFKIGDKVIVARRGENFVRNGSMDQYVGGSYIVKEVFDEQNFDSYYYLAEANGDLLTNNDETYVWFFGDDCLELDGPYAKHHMIAREICGKD